jgi:HEAT repeat protein
LKRNLLLSSVVLLALTSGCAVSPASRTVDALTDSSFVVRHSGASHYSRLSAKDQKRVKQSLRAKANSRSKDARGRAQTAIGTLGEDAKDLIDVVVAGLSDRRASVRAQAANALWRVDSEDRGPVPKLLELLQDESKDVREEAARALGFFVKNAGGVAAALEKGLGDPEASVANTCIEALGRLKPAAISSIPAISALPEGKYRGEYVAKAFGAMGPAARAGIPTLINILRSSESHYGEEGAKAAARALVVMGPPAVEPVLTCLTSERFVTRMLALRVLASIAHDRQIAVKPITQLLVSRPKSIFDYESAAMAMGGIGPKAWTAVPRLFQLLPSESGHLKHEVAIALRKIVRRGMPSRAAVLDVLRENLESPSARVRSLAAELMGELLVADQETLTRLEALALNDASAAVRAMAIYAVGESGQASFLRSFVKLLADPSAHVRRMAAYGLGRVGDPESATAVLRKALKDKDPSVVRQVKLSLHARQMRDEATLGASFAKPIVEPLDAKTLQERFETLGRETLFSERVDRYDSIPRGERAAAQLRDMASKNVEIRRAAAHWRARRGAVFKMVRDAINDPDAEVRHLLAMAVHEGLSTDTEKMTSIASGLSHPDPFVRFVLVLKAEELAAEGVWYAEERVAILAPLLQHDSPEAREAVATALSRLRGYGIFGRVALRTAADDPNPTVRAAIAGALDDVHTYYGHRREL